MFEGWKVWPLRLRRLEARTRVRETPSILFSNEFRQIGRDFQLEVSNGLREAVVRLRKRLELLTGLDDVGYFIYSSIYKPRYAVRP